MTNLLGKRYECSACGAELLCTKPGDGSLVCCGREMAVKLAKPLPTSD
jgi:desulfoferrodoxin-like iron-binding protein